MMFLKFSFQSILHSKKLISLIIPPQVCLVLQLMLDSMRSVHQRKGNLSLFLLHPEQLARSLVNLQSSMAAMLWEVLDQIRRRVLVLFSFY